MANRIIESPNNKVLLRKLRESPDGIGLLWMRNAMRTLHRESVKNAPRGVTSNLAQSIDYDRRPTVVRGSIRSYLFSDVSYAESVHDGNIPQPQAGRTPASRVAIRRWMERKGIPSSKYYPIVENLRNEGVSRPTPFFKQAVDSYTRADSTKALRMAVSQYQRGIR